MTKEELKMNSKEALENIRNGKFITCKICSNNYNQWLTGCMCCRNELSKSKELDIIEKDLDRLEKDNYKLQKALEIYSNNVTVYEEKGRYYMACCDGGCRGIEITKEEYMELILILYDFSNMFKNCSKLEPLPLKMTSQKALQLIRNYHNAEAYATYHDNAKNIFKRELDLIGKDLEILQMLKKNMSIKTDYYDDDMCHKYEYIAYNGMDLWIESKEEFNKLKEWLENDK